MEWLEIEFNPLWHSRSQKAADQAFCDEFGPWFLDDIGRLESELQHWLPLMVVSHCVLHYMYIYIYISWIWINIRIPNKDGNAIILRIWPLDVFRGFNEFLRSQLISECRGSNMTVESPCLLRVMPADLSWGWGCQWIRKLASVMLELLKRHENSWKYTPNLFGWWFWRWLKTVGTSFQQIIWFIPCSKRFRISCIVFSGASIPAAAREQQGRRRPQLKPPWTGHEAGPAEPWERCSLVVKHGEPLATGLNADKWFVK